MEKITFKQLDRNFIAYTLGFEQVHSIPELSEWFEIAKIQNIEGDDERMLKRLQYTLLEWGADWNEFELSEWFIGPLLSLIDFNTKKFKLFAFRDMSAIVKDYELCGRPDAMIAKGISSPILPYFCFHEYKRETDPDGNPLTQLLGAMIAAQELNKNNLPIYGIYVIGKTWCFVVLKDNQWAESKKYIADDDTMLFDIFKILKTLKELISSHI